jgi:ribosomal protein S18 acetylase RimI-like enzyme
VSGNDEAPRVVAFAPDDWELLRALRLRALAEDPYAFGSTHVRELAFDEATWRERTTRMAYATVDGEPAGIAGAGLPDDDSVELLGMWTAPEFRGRGVGRALVDWAITSARELGRRRVGLWYADGNESARRLYERCGFVETDEHPEVPYAKADHRMVMQLPDPVERGEAARVDELVIPVLRVADAARAVRWYARLGFVKQWEHQFAVGFPWFVCITRGPMRLYLSEHLGDARPDTLLHLNVGNIDTIAAEFEETVDEHGLAGRQVNLVDPDGNRLRIATPRG